MLSNSSSDWALKINKKKAFNAQNPGEIPITYLGKKLGAEYLAVYSATTGYKPTWDFGGTIWVAYNLLGKDSFTYSHDLRIDAINVVRIPLVFEGEYKLFFKPPKWFPDYEIKVWEYTGEIPQQQTEINIDLSDFSAQLLTAIAELQASLQLILDKLDMEPPPPEPPDLEPPTVQQQEFFFFQ